MAQTIYNNDYVITALSRTAIRTLQSLCRERLQVRLVNEKFVLLNMTAVWRDIFEIGEDEYPPEYSDAAKALPWKWFCQAHDRTAMKGELEYLKQAGVDDPVILDDGAVWFHVWVAHKWASDNIPTFDEMVSLQ